ncbi:MAG: hypothetical protein ACOCY1_00690 [Halovenus sp.]
MTTSPRAGGRSTPGTAARRRSSLLIKTPTVIDSQPLVETIALLAIARSTAWG